tara:strand:- start:578 stop:1213 length:636 start_codon:yes stop_codon:yes gene_type:complete
VKVVSKMNKENDEKLVKAFPLLYGDRYGSEQSTAMCWGFPGDGWFDIIWDLSSKLEPIIRKFIADNPNLECSTCGCERAKHYASATDSPGRCLSIYADPTSEEKPPGNYRACFCDSYAGMYPKAFQVKEKFAGLRFYMTTQSDEITVLIEEAEALSLKTCEECGEPGEKTNTGWLRTLCKNCDENWVEIRANNHKKALEHEQQRRDALLPE